MDWGIIDAVMVLDIAVGNRDCGKFLGLSRAIGFRREIEDYDILDL